MPDSDETLFLRFQTGSRADLQELAARYDAALLRFFARRLRDPSLAADLVQETFVVLLKIDGRTRLETTFRSYLFGVAFRILLAAARKERQHAAREVPLDATAETVEQRLQAIPEQWLSIRQILDRMEDVDREILMLREYEQLAYREIAELLHIPINTVRSRLYRARLAFREQYELRGGFMPAEGGSVCQ